MKDTTEFLPARDYPQLIRLWIIAQENGVCGIGVFLRGGIWKWGKIIYAYAYIFIVLNSEA